MSRLSQLGKEASIAPPEMPLDLGAASDAPTLAQADTANAWNGKTNIAEPQHPRIEVEVVIGGCLMRLHYQGVSPAQILGLIKGYDPGAKVRDDFPAKGGFGKRETKRARIKAITLKASPNGLFIDLVCKAEKSVSVTVSKKIAPDFLRLLAETGKVGEENMAELNGAVEAKSQATVMLDDTEAVDAEYWTSDDGKAFLESLHAAEATP